MSMSRTSQLILSISVDILKVMFSSIFSSILNFDTLILYQMTTIPVSRCRFFYIIHMAWVEVVAKIRKWRKHDVWNINGNRQLKLVATSL